MAVAQKMATYSPFSDPGTGDVGRMACVHREFSGLRPEQRSGWSVSSFTPGIMKLSNRRPHHAANCLQLHLLPDLRYQVWQCGRPLDLCTIPHPAMLACVADLTSLLAYLAACRPCCGAGVENELGPLLARLRGVDVDAYFIATVCMESQDYSMARLLIPKACQGLVAPASLCSQCCACQGVVQQLREACQRMMGLGGVKKAVAT
jgi:hypothetical protein